MNGNVSQLVVRLSEMGRRLKRELGEDFGKVGFRLLELIRAGKRDAVMYTVTRIFMTNRKQIDQDLLEAFNPSYDIETFRILILAFFSQVVKPEEGQQGRSQQESQQQGT